MTIDLQRLRRIFTDAAEAADACLAALTANTDPESLTSVAWATVTRSASGNPEFQHYSSLQLEALSHHQALRAEALKQRALDAANQLFDEIVDLGQLGHPGASLTLRTQYRKPGPGYLLRAELLLDGSDLFRGPVSVQKAFEKLSPVLQALDRIPRSEGQPWRSWDVQSTRIVARSASSAVLRYLALTAPEKLAAIEAGSLGLASLPSVRLVVPAEEISAELNNYAS